MFDGSLHSHVIVAEWFAANGVLVMSPSKSVSSPSKSEELTLEVRDMIACIFNSEKQANEEVVSRLSTILEPSNIRN